MKTGVVSLGPMETYLWVEPFLLQIEPDTWDVLLRANVKCHNVTSA